MHHKNTNTEQTDVAAATVETAAHDMARRGEHLILFRLRCTQTANGLSHYYMYGDVAPEETLL